MVNHKIWLYHVANDEVGIRLQGALEIAAPEPNMTAVTVPGRNGDLHYYDGSYKNRPAGVGAYVYRPEDVKDAFGEIHEWLFGAVGYRRKAESACAVPFAVRLQASTLSDIRRGCRQHR